MHVNGYYKHTYEICQRCLPPVSRVSSGSPGGWWFHVGHDPWEDAMCMPLWRDYLFILFLSGKKEQRGRDH